MAKSKNARGVMWINPEEILPARNRIWRVKSDTVDDLKRAGEV